jgi:C4-dicarboxylate-specific signal transduction histidine kinase
LLMPDGAVKYVHVIAHGIENQAGQLEFIGAVMDITASKQAEAKLQNAQAELAHVTRLTTLGELTASIAHEVNQPLAAVVANAEACLRCLDRETPDLAAARRSAEWVIDDGNRASEVVRRVRALANKSDIAKVPLDINEVVREVIVLVQRELSSHQVSLRMDLESSLPRIGGDRIQLEQVIINLVVNGIEAMQPVTDRPRELVIRSRRDATRRALVSVSDCGVGIFAENANRLSTPSSPPSRAAWAWGYRSAVRSWKPKVEACQLAAMRDTVRRFNLSFPFIKSMIRHDRAAQTVE